MRKIFFAFTILMLLLTTSYGYSYIRSNNGESGYSGSDDGSSLKGTTQGSSLIQWYIIEGANSFIISHQHLQSLLSMVENQDQGFDFNLATRIAETSLYHMQIANFYYSMLVYVASQTPYDPVFQQKLIQFNYCQYSQENNLIQPIFERVESYLGQGDITGLFLSSLSAQQQIEKKLRKIIEELRNETVNTASYWNASESFNMESIFGSYAARVFMY